MVPGVHRLGRRVGGVVANERGKSVCDDDRDHGERSGITGEGLSSIDVTTTQRR